MPAILRLHLSPLAFAVSFNQKGAFMRNFTSPGSIIWVSCHLIMAILGAATLASDVFANILGEELTSGLGGGLISTGIAGVVLFLYVHTTDSLKQRLEVFTAAGITQIFRHRSVRIKDEYDRRLAAASAIDVLGWGLSAFREDYGHEFEAWSKQAKVRILLINPDYPKPECSLADLRDVEEGRPVGDIRQHVQAFLTLIHSLPELDPQRFHVRQMNALPAINLLRADNEIFWGPYLMGQQSRNTSTLLVRRGGFQFDSLEAHFDRIWQQSGPDL